MNHSKRYAIIFNKWTAYKNIENITEFDTIEEANEEMKLLEEMYADTPRPEHKWYNESKSTDTEVSHYRWNAASWGEAFWGYILIDFQEEKVLTWGHDGLRVYKKHSDIRKLKDRFFRGENEIPKDYKWSAGEYDGWLQFRWGNGKNSVEYGENTIIDGMKNTKECIRRCKYRKKKNYNVNAYNENEETYLDELNAEILAEVETEKILS